AEATVIKEKLAAEAIGYEQKGLAEARVKEAVSVALQKEGLAEATVTREKLQAQASGEKQRGLAEARVREAGALAIEKQGAAEALSIQRKMEAEAAGLAQKAESMRALDETSREHEEFRLQLDKEKAIDLAGLEMRKDVAHAQAQVLAKAMESAKIQIVGGDGRFFDQFVQAITLGKSIDGTLDSSEALQTALAEYMNGKRSLPSDVRDVLSRPAIDASALRDVSVSALMAKLGAQADGALKAKLSRLEEMARDLDE
ncbi:MAG: hypothetical protein H5U40_05885, partial [Polyangiaceae bacterium]|nr:hypothetical protein [Polyangiaceae bacterium]